MTPTTPRPWKQRLAGLWLLVGMGALYQLHLLTYHPTPVMPNLSALCARIDTSTYLGPANAAREARRTADLELPASERYARILGRRQQQPARPGQPR